MGLVRMTGEHVLSLVTDILDEFVKETIIGTIEEKQLHKQVEAFLDENFNKIFVDADLEHEVDFDGLKNYFKTSMLNDINNYLQGRDSNSRANSKNTIVKKLKEYMKYENDAEMFLGNLISIVKEFKCKDIPDGYKNLAAEVTEQLRFEGEKNTQQILDAVHNKDGQGSKGEEGQVKRILQNRRDEYKQKWDENMFLNDNDDPEDENATVGILLNEMYILPKYALNGNTKGLDTLRSRMQDVSNATKIKDRMLLILGQPGIGKSSLITWFINEFEEKLEREILVYRFTDFQFIKNGILKDSSFFESLVEEIGISCPKLENKILFLDGFDEIEVTGKRSDLLNDLYSHLSEKTKDCSLFITCRENYISDLSEVQCRYINIQTWDEGQIEKFYDRYKIKLSKMGGDSDKNEIDLIKAQEEKRKLIEKKEIFGIPLILYITLALEIELKQESTVVDIYDQIFGKNGVIYDKSIKRVNADSYDKSHRIAEIKNKIREVSAKIAIWMFHNNPEQASITERNYKIIVAEVLGDADNTDFFLGNYFKVVKHCEGVNNQELVFVHRSIYEYFVCDSLYSAINNSIKDPTKDLTDENQKKVALDLVPVLQAGTFTVTIEEYLKCKFEKEYKSLDEKVNLTFYTWWENAFAKMLDEGIFSFVGVRENAKTLNREIYYFHNFIGLLRILRASLVRTRIQYVMGNSRPKLLNQYVSILASSYQVLIGVDRMINFENLDLSGLILRGANLEGANLEGANLEGANLEGANLEGANLEGADLREANLEGANLVRANLEGADLFGADLEEANLVRANLFGADLREANLEEANLKGANLFGADLREANLEEANLEGADLFGADLEEANLTGTILE